MAIPRFKNENIGSLQLIEYIPFYGIQAFNPSGAGIINQAGISLLPGYAWQAIYCSQDTMGHQQDLSSSDQGESFTQQVIGLVPGDETEIEAGLLDLITKRFVLRITLSNGTRKIVGNPAEPLLCKLRSTTADTIPGRPGTSIIFSGDTLTRALFLVP